MCTHPLNYITGSLKSALLPFLWLIFMSKWIFQTLDSLEKTLMLGQIESRRRRGWQKMRWLDGITDAIITLHHRWTWNWANSGRQWRTGKPGLLQSMGSQRVRHDWATEQWTTTKWYTVSLINTLYHSLISSAIFFLLVMECVEVN